MIYKLTEIKQGTGFSRDARFVTIDEARQLRAALAELVEVAAIYSDIAVSEKGQNALAFARGTLKQTEAVTL